ATFVGSARHAVTFRPHLGCVPMSGSGGAIPTAAVVRPGLPAVRRVRTVRVTPGRARFVAARCAPAESLVSGSHAVGFYTSKPPATIILVVDVSGSMEANDVRPTRLAAAQQAVRSFLDRVPPQIRIALIAFSGDAEVAAPPTTDRALLRKSLESISSFPAFG